MSYQRMTISFDSQYKQIYEKLSEEKNKSKIICQALEEYYNIREENELYNNDLESLLLIRLDAISNKLDKIDNKINK